MICFIKKCYQFLKVLEICLMLHDMLCHIMVQTLHIWLVCCCLFFFLSVGYYSPQFQIQNLNKKQKQFKLL